MTARSLTATPKGIEQINRALTEKEWSRDDLWKNCGCSRQPAINFGSGKPVSKKLFVSFCKALELDWKVISGSGLLETAAKSGQSEADINPLTEGMPDNPRLQLFDDVKNLPPPEFGRLLFALKPPYGIVAGAIAPQGERTKQLLDWADGSTGPGLEIVKQELFNLKEPSFTKHDIDLLVQTREIQITDDLEFQNRKQFIAKCQQQIVDQKLSVYDFIHCTTCASLVVYFPANIKERFRKDFQKIQDDHHTVQMAGLGNLMVQMKRKHFEDGFRLEFLQALEELSKKWSSS